MTQPSLNPIANMKIDYWYKVLVAVGVVLFILNGTSILSRYPTIPIAFLSVGMFLIGLGEWINHPFRARFIAPNLVARGYSRYPCAIGIIIDIIGVILLIIGIIKLF
ncbi:hypothetical protein ACOGYS_000200 [Edwardsiella piscicida]